VAHACNPSYSGGRDQEDCSSKPACANNSWDSTYKKATPIQNKAGRVAQVIKPLPSKHEALNSSTTKKEKEKCILKSI
jgi:hypothetical protein